MTKVVGMLIVGALLAMSRPAGAGDSSYRRSVKAKSRALALARRGVAVLERQPGPGRDHVFSALAARFATEGAPVTTASPERSSSDSDARIAVGPGGSWFLEVRGEGDWVRYRNSDYLTSFENPVLEEPLSVSEVERCATAFLESSVPELVPMTQSEELRAWTTSYLRDVGTDASGELREVMLAAKIVLSRVINGVPVLGSGSKVAVIVANNCEVVGFDVDWSTFGASGRIITTVPLAQVRTRLSAIRGGAAGPEASLECGYYDPGADGSPRSVLLQTACISATVPMVSADGLQMPTLIRIAPAGRDVEFDPGWPTLAAR
jgi:hypothetical protein